MALSETGKAIANVSSLLKYWLNKKTGYHVEVGRPEPPKNASTDERLNIFLYEVHFDASLKNVSLEEGQPAPLWLMLKYLLTAFDIDGDSESTKAHEYLGEGIRALQELNFLSLTNETLTALEDNPEPLKITFDEANSELLSKLMQGPDEKYRFSVGFQVRPVMIATGEPPSLSLLVGIDYTKDPNQVLEEEEKGVHIPVIPSMGPEITGISPSKFEVDDTVTVYGNNLDSSGLYVRLGSVEVDVIAQPAGKLKFKVNGKIEEGKVISAGSHPLSVVQLLPTGRCRTSNFLTANLLPVLEKAEPKSITNETTDDSLEVIKGNIEMTGFLLGRKEDDIRAALFQDGKVVKQLDKFSETETQKKLTLKIEISDRVVQGDYRVILLVNGQQAKNSPQVELVP